jgi:class 3 adenylate cyclase
VKSTGDGILATFDGPGRAVRCALAFGTAAQQMGLPLRAGVHTGEIEVRGQDVGGIAVHAAARVMAQSGANEVLVSRVVTDLVAGAGLKFTEPARSNSKVFPVNGNCSLPPRKSECGTKRRFARCKAMSGVGGKADLPVERHDFSV